MRVAGFVVLGCMVVACASFGASGDDPGTSPAPGTSATTTPPPVDGASPSSTDAGETDDENESATDGADAPASCTISVSDAGLLNPRCQNIEPQTTFAGATVPAGEGPTEVTHGSALCGSQDGYVFTIAKAQASDCYELFFDSDDPSALLDVAVDNPGGQLVGGGSLMRGKQTAVTVLPSVTVKATVSSNAAWRVLVQ